MAARTRVVVTGLGVVCPLGSDVETYWSNAVAGRSGIRTITSFDCSDMPVKFGGEVVDFDPGATLGHKLVKTTDRFGLFALQAAGEALASAGVRPGETVDRNRIGSIVGSGIGGLGTILEQTTRLIERGPRRVSPFFVPKMMPNAAAGSVAIHYGLGGPNFATASACAASSHAIGTALMMLRAGMADVMLAGGAEAALNRLGLAAFCAARALSVRNDAPAQASRPFDRDRDGFVLGEGAGVLVLEPLERARARGATILAEVAGFGASDDAHHMTMPEPEGLGAVRALRAALHDAEIAPEEVQVVSAHGTATPLGDVAETKALKQTFGEHARRLWITATKSQVGHLLGAAGVIGAIASILALDRGVVPPTINLDTPDPACDLDYVPNTARESDARVAIASSFGFGGHNATLVFRRLQ